MLKGLGDMAKMMKKAQEMQGKMNQIQDDLEQVEVHAEAGAGLVKITSNAKGQVKSLEIRGTPQRKLEKINRNQ